MTGSSEKPARPYLLAGLIGGVVGAGTAVATMSLLDNHDPAPLAELRTAHERFVLQTGQALDELRDSQAEALRAADLQPLEERLAGIEADSTLENALAGLRGEIAHLEELYRAEIASLRGARAKTAAAALALREIATAIDSGQSFATALEQLTAILDDDATLTELANKLAPYAQGVPSLSRLAGDLDSIRVDAIRASGADAGSWVGRTVENLRALIDVEGLPELKGLDGQLRDAREKTILNQLPAAISEIAPLQDEVPALRGWLEQARARQAATTLLAALDRHLDERLSRQG